MHVGWQRLIPPDNCFEGEGAYRIDAYSEFLPPPRVGWKPYEGHHPDPELFHDEDPHGWYVSEFAEARELQPGLIQIGKQVIGKLARLADGKRDIPGLKADLIDNPFWSKELAEAPALPHERCVTLLPLALSRTQDDKGRVRWTLFGNSEQGPGKAFWKSFYRAPRKELPAEEGAAFFCRLLQTVHGVAADGLESLRKAGFRVAADPHPLQDNWREELPSWTMPLHFENREPTAGVRYLLTFAPFESLPQRIRKAYLGGELHLLPCPGSLVFWGVPGYRRLMDALPLAMQIPLLLGIARHRMAEGIRVPQSGYMHEPSEDRPNPRHQRHAALLRNTFKRTHRWDKVLRDEDELALIGREDELLHVLFSTVPEDIDLYNKPMARNVQLWTDDYECLLDGPSATPDRIKHALNTVEAGGTFGYRFLYPAMRVGRHEVYWHRPLVGYRDSKNAVHVLPDAPTGYLTAYDTRDIDLERPVELWPRLLHRPVPEAILALQSPGPGRSITPTVRSVNKLLDAYQKRGNRPLPRSLFRQLLIGRRDHDVEAWLDSIPDAALASEIRGFVEADAKPVFGPLRPDRVPPSLTYSRTATRRFEVAYWKTIAALSEGTFLNKNNADCIRCGITQKLLPYHVRQLDDLGDYLLGYYQRKIAAAKLEGQALAGEVPFRWRTDFEYPWMEGWLQNQEKPAERDLLIMIPGRDRSRAVIMADHYDTAYMADRYDRTCGGVGARIAACGADDNHSATAAMMLAAPIFLELSKRGKLACDIWLVHLTGEEFPADCLGARALTEQLVQKTLRLHLPDGETRDLSRVRVKGLYVSDMIAHNNDRERDIFQISPGSDPAAFWLAEQAHAANEIWNASVPIWNKDPERAGKERGRRSPHGGAIPLIAPFLQLSGEVRSYPDPRSTLYNTDGQIFSDAGVPCVLFMENYDINRSGYHDTRDTMANIDLDYGAALCAITIESVARAATHEMGE
jgi:hypothetical protein